MLDVQELMNENMKELMKEIVVIIRHNIIDTMKTQISNNTTNLTPTTTPEPITQSPHPTPQVENQHNITDEMDIEKNPNKRKAPTPSTENEHQEESKEIKDNITESTRKNKERAAARKSRTNKTQQNGHKQT